MRYFFLEEYFANGDIVAERVDHSNFPHAIRFHHIKDTGPYCYTVTVNFNEREYIITTAGCAKRIKYIEARGATLDEALSKYVTLWKSSSFS